MAAVNGPNGNVGYAQWHGDRNRLWGDQMWFTCPVFDNPDGVNLTEVDWERAAIREKYDIITRIFTSISVPSIAGVLTLGGLGIFIIGLATLPSPPNVPDSVVLGIITSGVVGGFGAIVFVSSLIISPHIPRKAVYLRPEFYSQFLTDLWAVADDAALYELMARAKPTYQALVRYGFLTSQSGASLQNRIWAWESHRNEPDTPGAQAFRAGFAAWKESFLAGVVRPFGETDECSR